MARSRSRAGGSRVVTALRARQEHGSTVEAVRAAQPASLKGYTAQKAALGAAGTWQRRHELAPVTGAVVTAAAGSAWPVQTAGALLAGAAGQDVLRRLRRGFWSAAERSAATSWALGAAGWSGAHLVVAGGAWWQWLLGLGAATGWQSYRWWTADPDQVPEAAPVYVEAVCAVLGELAVDGGPLTGSRITAVHMPADQVVVADVELGYGLHARDTPTAALRSTVEARLQTPLDGVEVKVVGVSTLRLTVSWTQVLDAAPLTWRPSPPGQAWLGQGDDRQDVALPAWLVGKADGKVSVLHGWTVGANGSGKSTTLTALLLPGLMAGVELVLMADGKGDSLEKLLPYIARYARLSGSRFEQVITLGWAIMRSRQARGWTGPSPTDPIVTLVIDEATSVKEQIDATTADHVFELGRMGRSLGVRVIQGTQTPLVDHLIGEGGWRANVRWVIGHRSGDATYSSIAATSTNEDISLLGLPEGRAAILFDGAVIARRAKIGFVTANDIKAAMDGVEPAQLHPADMAAVKPLWDLTEGWNTAEALTAAPAPVTSHDLRLARWDRAQGAAARQAAAVTPPPAHAVGQDEPVRVTVQGEDDEPFGCDDMATGGHLRLIPTQGTRSPSADPGGQAGHGGQGGQAGRKATGATARHWITTHLATAGPATAGSLVDAGPYSRSTVFDALAALLEDGQITKSGAVYQAATHLSPASTDATG